MPKSVSLAAPIGKAEVELRSQTLSAQNSEPFATSVGGAVKRCDGAVGRSTIYKAMQRGELRYRKCGARRVILIAELREWLQNLPYDPASMRHG